jgi:hypothetical protein
MATNNNTTNRFVSESVGPLPFPHLQ